MILDKGLGISGTRDLVETAGAYVDVVKFSFGTSAFYSEEICKQKTEMMRAGKVHIMPGGTFLEVAIWKKKYDQYLKRAKELGFDAIEVSDGTIDMDAATRETAIKKAVDAGFLVISEVGKKDPTEEVPVARMHELVAKDLECGSFKVIVEAREAGKGVGVFDKEGKVKEDEVKAIADGVQDSEALLWEAPIKSQQQYFILRFGTNVNLGNIPPADILALEALRQGLRGDTLKRAYREDK
jgi:phosphosulfolactate synthase